MGAIVYEYHSVLRFPTFFSYSKQPKLGKPILSLKDVSSSSPFERKGLPPTVARIGSQGDGGYEPPRRRSDSGRSNKNDGTKKRGSVGKKSNQEEIIALFRRIQTSISKQESGNAKKINSKVSEDGDGPSSESILRVLRGSRKQRGKAIDKEGEEVLTRTKGTKELQIQGDPPLTEFKLTRPPSKFVKRSPIPSPSNPGGELLELNDEESPSASTTKELDLVRVEEMKLPELKEVAKSRGIKGYSKLKKSELLKLLKS